jgi:hypothetical protein
MTMNPFAALGLPADPHLPDEQVRAAWRAIAAATHPDRPDGGDLTRYTQATAAYAQLRTPWARSEAYADLTDQQPGTYPLPALDPEPEAPLPAVAPVARTIRPLRLLPSRIRHGRPLRMLARAAAAALLAVIVLTLIPGTAAAPADIAGGLLWFALTARSDLAPPPRK